jgi:hypothetical protein
MQQHVFSPQQFNSMQQQKPLCVPNCNPSTLQIAYSKANNMPYHKCPNCRNGGSAVSNNAGVLPPSKTMNNNNNNNNPNFQQQYSNPPPLQQQQNLTNQFTPAYQQQTVTNPFTGQNFQMRSVDPPNNTQHQQQPTVLSVDPAIQQKILETLEKLLDYTVKIHTFFTEKMIRNEDTIVE